MASSPHPIGVYRAMALLWCIKTSMRELRLRAIARRRRARDFMESHSQQSDTDFSRECAVARGSQSIALALALRRALARFGHIRPEYLHAAHTFTYLEMLPNWGARIDVFFKRDSIPAIAGSRDRKVFSSEDDGRASRPREQYAADGRGVRRQGGPVLRGGTRVTKVA